MLWHVCIISDYRERTCLLQVNDDNVCRLYLQLNMIRGSDGSVALFQC